MHDYAQALYKHDACKHHCKFVDMHGAGWLFPTPHNAYVFGQLHVLFSLSTPYIWYVDVYSMCFVYPDVSPDDDMRPPSMTLDETYKHIYIHGQVFAKLHVSVHGYIHSRAGMPAHKETIHMVI